MHRRCVLTCALAILLMADGLRAQSMPASPSWHSVTTGGDVAIDIAVPAPGGKLLPVAIYLKNLSVPRLGREPDAPILADLLKAGHLVVTVDYSHDPKAVSPALNADILKLRQDILGHHFLPEYQVDRAHIFILAEGYRLERNVEFDRDGTRVLGMDIQYPADPPHPVPALLEYTCDNKDRMGTYSLVFCHDTLLDGAQLDGFAVAMADHPVPPPYKGLDDPMPEVVYRLKASVRTLRAVGPGYHMTDRIGVIGFSRGGPMAAILAVSNGQKPLEGPGPHAETSSAVQAALIHGNRYDYLDLRKDDPMLARFAKAWGNRETEPGRWAAHGASSYIKGPTDIAPMFLNTSNAESHEYQDGLALFEKRLTELGIEHQYQVDQDGRGHQVSSDPKTLGEIYAFFHKHLDQ